jgi:hypothetical protein
MKRKNSFKPGLSKANIFKYPKMQIPVESIFNVAQVYLWNNIIKWTICLDMAYFLKHGLNVFINLPIFFI